MIMPVTEISPNVLLVSRTCRWASPAAVAEVFGRAGSLRVRRRDLKRVPSMIVAVVSVA